MQFLVARLRHIAKTHTESLRLLTAYVKQSTEDITRQKTRFEDMLAKLPDSPVDEPVWLTPEDSDEKIMFDAGQYKILRSVFHTGREQAERFPPLLLEMAFIYRTALYDALVPDVLSAILFDNQAMLKSKKMISHEEIIESKSIFHLVHAMVRKELAADFEHKPVTVQFDYIKNKFGMELVKKDEDKQQLVELMARRNLLVHANGMVDATYCRLVPSHTSKPGPERLTVDDEYFNKAHELLTAITEVLLTLTSINHAKQEQVITIESPFQRLGDLVSGQYRPRYEI
jgi:hypothetical protein